MEVWELSHISLGGKLTTQSSLGEIPDAGSNLATDASSHPQNIISSCPERNIIAMN
jgi:hypothetical protein